MTIDSFKLTEFFDYIKRSIPQPFGIKSDDVVSLKVSPSTNEHEITLKNKSYTITRAAIRKLVDSLGVKIKLLNTVAEHEIEVYELITPILDKLFKCYADCFVFYSTSDDESTIIDLNVHNVSGEEDTRYANGPSPWDITIEDNKEKFTCFVDFLEKYCIAEDDSDICVKSGDILNNAHVIINLFKELPHNNLQPMLTFCSKFSNMNGFSEIKPSLYDTDSGITIKLPINYSGRDNSYTFEEMWKKVIHIFESVDVDDFIFREINILASSNETPSAVKNFIQSILVESTINVNQPIKAILAEAKTQAEHMKPSKKAKLYNQLGTLIGYSLIMKHNSCHECGHMHI